MCGIIGILAKRPVADLLVEGLRRLEYRGYDSAGIATVVSGVLQTRRSVGKLDALACKLEGEPLAGALGIGHTRWATHGKPSEENAHPHASPRVAVVHNGIIENYRTLRQEMEAKGHVFKSETDTESIAHLITDYLDQGLSPQAAVAATLKRLDGAFAIAVIFAGNDDLLIGARRGSPLALGYGDKEMYLGSDALALAPLTNRISYLEDGDWVEISSQKTVVRDAHDQEVERKIHQTAFSGAMIGKGEYRHFMLKEIFDQPSVIGDTIKALCGQNDVPDMKALPSLSWQDVPKITIAACGTACYAGMVAKYWFEELAGIPVDVDIASEYRYRASPIVKDGMMIVISQSGETADTLAALKDAKAKGLKILAVVNVPQSSIARHADAMIQTFAGPEISVASTKAFTAQLSVLLILAVAAGLARGVLPFVRAKEIIQAMRETPSKINDILREDHKVQEISQILSDSAHALYLGRGTMFPLALEGALKLKEISYIHAEAYPAGELKHGPIALIDDAMPVVVLVPRGPLFEKTASNIQEVAARGGKIILFSDKEGLATFKTKGMLSFALPHTDHIVAPLLYAVPVQLLAYYAALAKGTDVDQPRNLAKSVTVE